MANTTFLFLLRCLIDGIFLILNLKKETTFFVRKQFLFVSLSSVCLSCTESHKAYREEKSYRTASPRSHRQSSHSPTAREHPLPIRHSIRTFPTTILPVACNHLPKHNQNTAVRRMILVNLYFMSFRYYFKTISYALFQRHRLDCSKVAW